MNKFASLLIALLLASCALPQAQNVDLAPSLTGKERQVIVNDAVQQLTALFPPAKTRLDLRPAGQDSFGILLAKDLRDQGYALQEATDNQPQASSGYPVRYVLDHPGELYRISLFIGTDSLSRAYVLENGAFIPAGLWVHKEYGRE